MGTKDQKQSRETTPLGVDVERLAMPIDGIYLISRSSFYIEDNPPCDEAYQIETLDVDRRNVDNPKKIPVHLGRDTWWYEKGENHRVENGSICRDVGFSKKWVVKIDNMVEFIKKYGTCVIDIDFDNWMTIEIYDDYRE